MKFISQLSLAARNAAASSMLNRSVQAPAARNRLIVSHSLLVRHRSTLRHLPRLALAFCCLPAWGQTTGRAIDLVNLQRLANGVLGIMSYTVAPDVTTSSLSVQNAATSNPGLTMTQLGGGFTWSKDTPLYLEGNAAYSRYDPHIHRQ